MFAYRKNVNKRFSYRLFSSKAGFSSPNFLKLVTDGQRNLSHVSVEKMAKGFGLKSQETKFFRNMVFMNQASSHTKKDHYYRKMTAMRSYTRIHRVDKRHYEYFSRWYYPVIREIIVFGDRKFTPSQIAKLLNPKISTKEAEKAIKILLELGLIEKDASGRWKQESRVVTTEPEIRSFVVANYHREMLKLAIESIDRFEPEQRDLRSLTLSVKQETVEELKKKIESYTMELLEYMSKEEDAEQVVQINMQLFPLSKRLKKEGL